MKIVGTGGGLFAKVVFSDDVHLPIYGPYACNSFYPVI
jgi:hypothetical protein